MDWRLLLKQSGPVITIIKGPWNVKVDALSRRDFMSPAPTQLIVDSAPQLIELQQASRIGLKLTDQSR
jgi:hypothetical protein